MNPPGPSVDSSIIIVRQLEQVEELRTERCSSHHIASAKERKTLKSTKILFWGRAVNYLQRAECVLYLCFGGVLVDLKSVFFFGFIYL